MDNARKKYVNIERLSSGDIFAFIESFESVDEVNIENVVTYSDTESVAEDESVISTYIIRKEKIGDQSSSVSFPEASMYIQLVFQSVAFKHASNQSPSPATQRTPNQSISHLLLPLNVLQISHLLLPLNVLRISHLQLLLLDILLISHLNILLLLQLLYQKKTRNGSKARWAKTQYSIRREQHKPEKRQCLARRRQNKEEKNQYDRGMEIGE